MSEKPITYFSVANWTNVPRPLIDYSVEDYRTYLVMHEAGHALGLDHEKCTATPAKAPIMLQHTKGLNGCFKNIWPLESEKKLLSVINKMRSRSFRRMSRRCKRSRPSRLRAGEISGVSGPRRLNQLVPAGYYIRNAIPYGNGHRAISNDDGKPDVNCFIDKYSDAVLSVEQYRQLLERMGLDSTGSITRLPLLGRFYLSKCFYPASKYAS